MLELFIIRDRRPDGTAQFFVADTGRGDASYSEAAILTADEAAEILARYPDAERVQVA